MSKLINEAFHEWVDKEPDTTFSGDDWEACFTAGAMWMLRFMEDDNLEANYSAWPDFIKFRRDFLEDT